MIRFTIRDVLWLMVVAAMGAVAWRDRIGINAERASLEEERRTLAKEIAAQRAALAKDRAVQSEKARKLLADLEARARMLDVELQRKASDEQARFFAEHVTQAEREQAKRRSMELGAPQPVPLPPGYGDQPNVE